MQQFQSSSPLTLEQRNQQVLQERVQRAEQLFLTEREKNKSLTHHETRNICIYGGLGCIVGLVIGIIISKTGL